MTKMEIVQELPKRPRAIGSGKPLSPETTFVIAALTAGQIARLECESPKEVEMRRMSITVALRRRGITCRTRIVDNTVYFAPLLPEDQR